MIWPPTEASHHQHICKATESLSPKITRAGSHQCGAGAINWHLATQDLPRANSIDRRCHNRQSGGPVRRPAMRAEIVLGMLSHGHCARGLVEA